MHRWLESLPQSNDCHHALIPWTLEAIRERPFGSVAYGLAAKDGLAGH